MKTTTAGNINEYMRKTGTLRGADIYTFLDPEKKLLVSTIFADLGIAGLHSITIFDALLEKVSSHHNLKYKSEKVSKLSASYADDSSLTYYDSEMTISMLKRSGQRRLLITAPKILLPSGETGFKADITIHDDALQPFVFSSQEEDGKSLAYTAKYMGMPSEGTLFIGDRILKTGADSATSFTWMRGTTQKSINLTEINAMGNGWAASLSAADSRRNIASIGGHLIQLGKCTVTETDNGYHIEEESGRLTMDTETVNVLRYRENLRPLRGEGSEIHSFFRGFISLGEEIINLESGYGSVREAQGKRQTFRS